MRFASIKQQERLPPNMTLLDTLEPYPQDLRDLENAVYLLTRTTSAPDKETVTELYFAQQGEVYPCQSEDEFVAIAEKCHTAGVELVAYRPHDLPAFVGDMIDDIFVGDKYEGILRDSNAYQRLQDAGIPVRFPQIMQPPQPIQGQQTVLDTLAAEYMADFQ